MKRLNWLQRAGARIFRLYDGGPGEGPDSWWTVVNASQPTSFQRTGKEVRQVGWEKNAVVQAASRAIVDIVASVELEEVRKTADGRMKPVAKSVAADLLNVEPWNGTNGFQFRGEAALYFLLYGNAFAEIQRSGGTITGVRKIHPERICYAYVDKNDQIVRWEWKDTQGAIHYTDAQDMLHFRDLSSSPDMLFGYPRAASALLDIAIDSEASAYVRQVVGNHGQPGAVVTAKGFNNKEEMLRAETSFNERMTARGGRGRAVFMNGEDLQYTPIGFNLTQLEFPDLRAISREDICAAFGVDPRMVSIGSAQKGGSNLSGAEYQEARFRLIQQAVIPLMKAFEAELNRWYMPEFGLGQIRFKPDSLADLTEDEQQTSTRVIAEVLAGITTVEEARESIGRAADLDPEQHLGGGSKVKVQVALEQAALDPVEKAQQMAEAVPGSPLPPRNTDTPTGPEKATSPQTAGATPASQSGDGRDTRQPTARLLVHRMLDTAAEKDRYWRAFDQRAQEQEPGFLRVIHDLFQGDWRAIAGAVAVGHLIDHVMYQAILARLAQIQQTDLLRWENALRPVIRNGLIAGARHAIMVGPPGSASYPTTLLIAAERDAARTAAQQIVGTTYEEVRGLVATAEGKTPEQVAGLIRQTVFGKTLDARATAIAKSEIAAAINRGAWIAASAGRNIRSKMWVTQRDERVRASHTHAEEQGWIPLEKAFWNGLQYPGDPVGAPEEIINCRCTLAYSEEPHGEAV